METIYRTFHPEIKAVNADKGIFDAVVSDETLDLDQEIVIAAGWKFTYFQKNSPLVDSHDSSTIKNLVGKVIDFRVQNGKLIERIQWAIDVPENQLAVIGCKMMAAGYLKAFSVGFRPLSYLTPRSGKEWSDALRALKVPADADIRCIYTSQEQIELSVCITPANPNALVQLRSKSVLTADEISVLSVPSVPSSKMSTSSKTSSRETFMKTLEIITHRSGVPTTKNAFDTLEITRRNGTARELEHALSQTRVAVLAERRDSGPDEIEKWLDQPGVREFWNALARKLMTKRCAPEFEPVFKDLDVSASGTGAAFFLPQALSEQIFDLLPIYGAFATLGLRKIPKMFTKFPQVNGLPSAVFINATQGNVAVPKDTAFVGSQLLPEANTVASILPVSIALFDDAATDLGSVIARYFIQGMSARVDWAAFQGNGVVDAGGLNGGQTGIMVDNTINTFNAAAGNAAVEQLDRSDFLGVIRTVAPAALQRPCRWWINPGFIPILLTIAEANGANWLLKTPAESADGSWSLAGFPVTWAAQMPAIDGPAQKFAAFGEPNSYLVALSDEFKVEVSDHSLWSTLQKSFRCMARCWCQTREKTGLATLTTAPK